MYVSFNVSKSKIHRKRIRKVVRSTPHAMRKLEDKVSRYYTLDNDQGAGAPDLAENTCRLLLDRKNWKEARLNEYTSPDEKQQWNSDSIN